MDMEMENAVGFTDGGADEAQGQAVAAPEAAEGVSEPAGAATPQPEAAPQDGQDAPPPEAAIPAPQSREWNDAMKQARVSGRQEAERQIKEAYAMRLASSGLSNPSTGKPFANLDEFLEYSDTVTAANQGISVEQLRAQREEQEQLPALRAELAETRTKLAHVELAGELAELKKTFPEIKAKNVFELGEDFVRMRAAGVSPDTAYLAVKGAKDMNTKAPPPSMGGLSKQSPEREYFTSEELDALTDADLDKPGMYDKAMKSLRILGKKQ